MNNLKRKEGAYMSSKTNADQIQSANPAFDNAVPPPEPQEPVRAYDRKIYDSYIFSHPMKTLLTWLQVTGIITIVFSALSVVLCLFTLIKGAVLFSILTLALNAFCIWISSFIVSGTKNMKAGLSEGCYQVCQALRILRVVIFIGYALIGILEIVLLFFAGGSRDLAVIFPLVMIFPLFIVQRFYKGLINALEQVGADMEEGIESEYNNPVRLSLLSYILAGISVLCPILFVCFFSKGIYKSSLEFLFPQIYALLTMLSVIPLYLIGRLNDFIALAHRPGITKEDVQREVSSRRFSALALFGSAFVFSYAISNGLANIVPIIRDYYLNTFSIIWRVLGFCSMILFGVGFHVKKRNVLFAVSSCGFLISSVIYLVNGVIALFVRQQVSILFVIMEICDVLLLGLFVFFAFYPIAFKKDLPKNLRLIPVALCVILYIINIANDVNALGSYFWPVGAASTISALIYRAALCLISLNSGWIEE